MRPKIGKLLHWFLNGFDPVGYLMRGSLYEALKSEGQMVGKLSDPTEGISKEDAPKPRKYRYLVVETREVMAEDSLAAMSRVGMGEGRPISVQAEEFPAGLSKPFVSVSWARSH